MNGFTGAYVALNVTASSTRAFRYNSWHVDDRLRCCAALRRRPRPMGPFREPVPVSICRVACPLDADIDDDAKRVPRRNIAMHLARHARENTKQTRALARAATFSFAAITTTKPAPPSASRRHRCDCETGFALGFTEGNG